MIDLLTTLGALVLFAVGAILPLLRRDPLAASLGPPLMAAGAVLVAAPAPGGESFSLLVAGLALAWVLVAVAAIPAHHRRGSDRDDEVGEDAS